MSERRPPTPEEIRRAAQRVVAVLREADHEAYFVGGAVRDALLGRPVKDIDVATSATPDTVQRLFRKVIPVGAQFGVCRVRVRGVETEVATFRTDDGYVDGRRPSAVTFTDAREDVLRRDFTINGLLQDPESGEILDFVEGRADLEAGVVRAIGDPERRFAEDRLRMLRAVRFGARFGFAIDPATETAIGRHAPAIVEVSAERIAEELRRILVEGGAGVGFAGLVRTGLLRHVLPAVGALAQDDIAAVQDALTRLGPCDDRLGFAALLHRLDGDAARDTCRRLKLPKRLIRDVPAAVVELPAARDAAGWPLSRLKRTLRADYADILIPLAQLTQGNSGGAGHLAHQAATIAAEELRPRPLLSGHDLQTLGYPKGPHYREMLAALETAQLDGDLTDADSARAFLTERWPLS